MNHTTILLDKYPIISEQVDKKELRVLLQELEEVLKKNHHGSVVEFGCYVGTTSLFIRRLLDAYDSPLSFHVYDSFVGLPEKTTQDSSPTGEQFVAGELRTSKKQFLTQFKKANLVTPIVHKGWFSDMAPDDVPDGIRFAFLDGDYYRSIKDSFDLLEKKLMPNAVIVVDDYMNEALPGAQKATDKWLRRHPSATCRVAHSLAIITL